MNTEEYNEIFTAIKYTFSGKTTQEIMKNEEKIMSFQYNPYQFCLSLLEYINSHHSSSLDYKTKLSVMIYIKNTMSKNCLSSKDQIDNKQNIRLIINETLTTITSGKLDYALIKPLLRAFKIMVENSPQSIVIIDFIIKHLQDNCCIMTNSINQFNIMIKLFKIAASCLLSKIDIVSPSSIAYQHLKWIFDIINQLLVYTVNKYIDFAKTYTIRKQDILLAYTYLLTKVYSFFDKILRLDKKNYHKLLTVAKMSNVTELAMKIIFATFPTMNQNFIIVYSRNKDINKAVNRMKTMIIKTVISISNNEKEFFPMKYLEMIEMGFIEQILVSFEAFIIHGDNIIKLYEQSSKSIEAMLLGNILVYFHSVIKKETMMGFIKDYIKDLAINILFPLLIVTKEDEEIIEKSPDDYVKIIEDAIVGCYFRYNKTTAALILKDICSDSNLTSFLCDYVLKYLNTNIGLYEQILQNPDSKTFDVLHENIFTDYNISIPHRIAVGLFIFLLMPMNIKDNENVVITSIQVFLRNNSGFPCRSSLQETPLIIKVIYVLLLKKYVIRLYNPSDEIFNKIIQYLYVTLSDADTPLILTKISCKALKLLINKAKANPNIINATLLEEIFSMKNLQKSILELQTEAFFILLKNYIKYTIQTEDFLQLMKVLCIRLKIQYSLIEITLTHVCSKNEGLISMIQRILKCILFIVKRHCFVSGNLNEIDQLIDEHLLPYVEYSLDINCYHSIIEVLLQVIIVKREYTKNTYDVTRKTLTPLIHKEDITVTVFRIINMLIVSKDNFFHNVNNHDFIFNLYSQHTPLNSTNPITLLHLRLIITLFFLEEKTVDSTKVCSIINDAISQLMSIKEGELSKEDMERNVTMFSLTILIYSGYKNNSKKIEDVVAKSCSKYKLLQWMKEIVYYPQFDMINKLFMYCLFIIVIKDSKALEADLFQEWLQRMLDIQNKEIEMGKETNCDSETVDSMFDDEEDCLDRKDNKKEISSFECQVIRICNNMIIGSEMQDFLSYVSLNE